MDNTMQNTHMIVNTYENELNKWSKMYILPQNVENTVITITNQYNQYNNIINIWSLNNMQKMIDLKQFNE